MTNGYKISGTTVFDMSPGSGFGTSTGGNECGCNRCRGSGMGAASGYGRGECMGYNHGRGCISDEALTPTGAGLSGPRGEGLGDGEGSGSTYSGVGDGHGIQEGYGFCRHPLSGTGFGTSDGSGVGHPRRAAKKAGWVRYPKKTKRSSKR